MMVLLDLIELNDVYDELPEQVTNEIPQIRYAPALSLIFHRLSRNATLADDNSKDFAVSHCNHCPQHRKCDSHIDTALSYSIWTACALLRASRTTSCNEAGTSWVMATVTA